MVFDSCAPAPQDTACRADIGDGVIPYDDELFDEWSGMLEGYLEDSFLMPGTQDGELRTEAVSEAQKDNYRTLRRH